MLKKLKSLAFVLTVIGSVVVLSGCGQKFAEGDPYYYVLQEIQLGTAREGQMNIYVVDPFEGKIFAYSPGSDNYEELPYDLEKYEDAEETFSFEYNNGEVDRFQKKSDSFWLSLETGIEYDAKKKEGEFDYSPMMYEVPWEEGE